MKFLEFHFGSRSSQEEPALLLCDDFSGHWIDEALAYAATINVVLMKVPPNATSAGWQT
ncbi:hypothetical protein JG687_00017316 [Phytophthora cactorum]|uniref:DDE-1 domain-containing protein n=1 Tax=Phytophthora cactorum TaxID=29920 RepID=A0A8T1TRU5_9STRA|nr:hypothetical protein JG687_00017316 [Phytophthora cactorum]